MTTLGQSIFGPYFASTDFGDKMVMRAAEHACAREATRLYSQFARESKVLKSKQYVSYYSLLFLFSLFFSLLFPPFEL